MKMKRIFSAIVLAWVGWNFPATAADLPIKAPAPSYVTNYQWSGFYLGAHVGGAINSTNQTITDGVVSIDIGSAPRGVLGGIEAGLDYQFAPQFVFGLYVEQDFADIRAGGVLANAITTNNVTNYLGAAGGRLGWLITPTTMLYAKGGFAWVGAAPDFSAIGTTKAITDTSVGTQIGGGLEHRLNTNWSVKVEYAHTHAGDKTIDLGALTSINKYSIDKATIGLDYRF